ncbi:oligosaccharide flippase family protein, partial [Vibrio cholerae]|nr:oligosaccharide flippase family protein [Vibrio cholerae]
TILSSVLTLLTQTVIASEIGPEEFGVFSSSLALVMLLSPIIAMGSDGYLLKFITKPNHNLSRFNYNWILYFVFTSFPTVSVFLVVDSSQTRQLLLLMISQSLINFCVAIFQSKKEYFFVSLLLSLQSFSRILALVFFIYISDKVTLDDIVTLYVLVAVIMVSICLLALHKYGFGVRYIGKEKLNKREHISFVKSAMPFGITTFLHFAYFQSDIIIINRLYSSEEAGVYSAAFMILTAAYMIPSVIYQKYFLPIAHRLSSSGEIEKEIFYFKKGFIYVFYLSLLISSSYYLLSDFTVIMIYGDDYIDSSFYLKLLSVCIIFRFISSNSGVYLMTGDLVHKKNKYMFVCAVFNIILNVIFIPSNGAIAAAITTISTEVLLCTLFYRGIKKYKFSKKI